MVLSKVEQTLDYKDVLIIPRFSGINSREDIDTVTVLSKRGDSELRLFIPVVSANMDTVTGYRMAKTMFINGGAGILHRYNKFEKTLEIVKILKAEGCRMIIPSIGISNRDVGYAEAYMKAGAHAICVDIAHGHSQGMKNTLGDLSIMNSNGHYIAGNIVTDAAARNLAEWGATAVKVGIGPGSACTTRMNTGVGFPQLSAVRAAAHALDSWGIPVIADGGMRCIGDMVKALAAGANAVMTGCMFTDCVEVEQPGYYRGMASAEAQNEFKGSAKNIEGVAFAVPLPTTTVAEKMIQFRQGIQSGMSYVGAGDIRQLQVYADFVVVK